MSEEEKDDGGPAFPTIYDMQSHTIFGNVDGMTLWDYFAAHGPAQFDPKDLDLDRHLNQLACINAQHADAILAERKKRFGEEK